MYIGLYDADLMFAPTKLKLNLEIMKLASYFSKSHMVELILDINDIDKYDKIYIRKDNKKSKLDNKILIKDNVYWGGLAFTNNIYIPLEPLEIEYCIPKISIYNQFFKKGISSGLLKEKDINSISNKNYLRLFINKEIANYDWVIPKNSIILYDTDLNHKENWQEAITKLGTKTNQKINFVQPIILRKLDDDFKYLIENNKISRRNLNIILDIRFSPTDFKMFVQNYAEMIKDFISFEARIKLIIGPPNDWEQFGENFYKNELMRIIEYVFYGLSKQLCFGVYIKENDNINKYEILYAQLKNWIEFRTNRNIDFYRYLENKGVGPQLKILDEIIEVTPYRAGRLFYTIPNKIRKGGYWQYE